MIFLELFTNADGSIAWLNIAVMAIAGILGYLIGSSPGKKQVNRLKDSIREKENQLRKAENDFKSHQHKNISRGMRPRSNNTSAPLTK